MPDSYSFVEWSHRSTSYIPLQGQRIYCGIVLRYRTIATALPRYYGWQDRGARQISIIRPFFEQD